LLLRLSSGLRVVAATGLGVAFLANLWFVIGLMRTRPQVYGEAEVLFEAARMHGDLPLYVDPVAGAFDYGAVPSRYYVCYPPVWSFVLSFVPPSAGPLFGRVACTLAWFGALFGIARAELPVQNGRTPAFAAATYGAGIYVIANLVTSGRPDAVAIAIVAFALVRTLRLGFVDFWAALLFALAVWVKPNVFGIAVGVALVTIVRDPRRALAIVLGVAAVSAPVALVLHLVSEGTWLVHFHHSLLQSLIFDQWWGRIWPRALFLAPAIFVGWMGWRGRGTPAGRLAFVGYLSATAWTLVSLAKVGASSNYWAEPMLAAVAVVRACPVPRLAPRLLAVASLGAAVHGVWHASATTISVHDAYVVDPAHGALIERARASCNVAGGGVLIADHPGPEQQVNGRIVSPAFQTEWLLLTGQFPTDLILRDIARPEVGCLLAIDDLEHGFLTPAVRRALSGKFVRVDEGGGWALYRAR
jgi:hypothetical protein